MKKAKKPDEIFSVTSTRFACFVEREKGIFYQVALEEREMVQIGFFLIQLHGGKINCKEEIFPMEFVEKKAKKQK